jgi:hypothetical protein
MNFYFGRKVNRPKSKGYVFGRKLPCPIEYRVKTECVYTITIIAVNRDEDRDRNRTGADKSKRMGRNTEPQTYYFEYF